MTAVSGLPPVGPPPAPPKDSRWLELTAAILLGIAAVLTAWASYRASLVSDRVISNYSEMQTKVAAANDLYGNADQARAQEVQFFVTFALEANRTGPEVAGTTAYLLDVMGPEMAAAVEWWAAEGDAAPATPFVDDNPELENLPSAKAFAGAEAAMAEAETFRIAAQKADADSDGFELANVFFAVTLFVAGIATLVRTRSITIGLLALGFTMVFVGAIVVVTTPGWASLS